MKRISLVSFLGILTPCLLAPGCSDAASSESVFNVREYGAVGDGVSDDTAGIQAAVAALKAIGWGTLFLPKGRYIVEAALTIDLDKVTLLGEGAMSVLKCKDGASINVVKAENVSGLTIRNLTIDGNRDGNFDQHETDIQNGILIVADTASQSDITIDHVAVISCFSDGVRIKGTEDYRIDRVQIQDCRFDSTDRGLRIDYCGEIHISGCITNNTEKGAIYLDQVHDGVEITYCDINDVGNLQAGIFVRGIGPTLGGGGASIARDCYGVTISNNYLTDNGGGGMGINTSGYVSYQTISGNVVNGWATDGITANQGYNSSDTGDAYCTITGNEVFSVGQYGISARSGSYSVVSDNFVHNTNYAGIFIGGRDANNIEVQNNLCYGNTYYGIYVNSVKTASIQGNHCAANLDGIYCRDASGLVVRSNFCYDNGRYGIHIQHTVTGAVVAENTLVNNAAADYHDEGGTNMRNVN